MATGALWSRPTQAVAIATLPSLQAQIALCARSWASRFCGKTAGGNLGAARAVLKQASVSHKPTMID
jgi:hypothetical protein